MLQTHINSDALVIYYVFTYIIMLYLSYSFSRDDNGKKQGMTVISYTDF